MAAISGNTAEDRSALEQADAEPSMEEILASIRQIIAEDDEAGEEANSRANYTHPENPSNSNEADGLQDGMKAAMEAEMKSADQAAPVPAVSGAAAADNEDKLEKYRVRGKLKIEELAEAKKSGAEPDAATSGVTKLPVAPPPIPIFNSKPAPQYSAPVQPAARPVVQPVITPGSVPSAASPEAVVKLAAEKLVEDRATELNALVEDQIRPVVRKWLGDNLPSLVERLVRDEIERVSRGKTA